jgi:hypothetical protein
LSFLPFQPTRSKKLDEKNQGKRERDFFSTTGVTVAAIIIIMAVVRLENFFYLFFLCILLRKENVSNSLITGKKNIPDFKNQKKIPIVFIDLIFLYLFDD